MTLLLPIVALALAALARFALPNQEPNPTRLPTGRAVALVALGLLGAGLVARFAPAADRVGIEVGLTIGVVAALLGEALGGVIAPLAVGVAGAAGLHAFGTAGLPAAQLAFLGGLGLGALSLGGGGALGATLAGSLAAIADNLGAHHSEIPGAAFLGTEIALAGVVGAILAGPLPARLVAFRPVVVGIVVVAGAFFAARSLGEGTLTLATGIGTVAGIVIHWLLPEDESADATRSGLATVIGIGVATLAFGFARGAGMALALVAAGGVLLGVGNRRAFLTLGPLLGLVLYRLLREAGTGATRALDIGQHYTLLALAVGAILPLLPTDWLRRDGNRGAVGAFLWGLVVLASPALVILMFGMRGAVGFVFGLGLSGLCQALRRESGLLPLGLATGMAGSTILNLGWMSEGADYTRDEKIHYLAYAGVAILLVAALIAGLSRPAKAEVAA